MMRDTVSEEVGEVLGNAVHWRGAGTVGIADSQGSQPLVMFDGMGCSNDGTGTWQRNRKALVTRYRQWITG